MSDKNETPKDAADFLKNLWGSFGIPPGLVAPVLDIDELDKRITDMKAVEGWLKMNLNVLQMSIQALEMQRATLAAMKAMGESATAEGTTGGNQGLWPWGFMTPPEAAVPPSGDKKN
ncbi:MAG: hypothetical protein M0P39_02430 [Rhodocyclaceae bacterium]|nr:hypothetical protein [Rhodocyclaceae bacterium]